SESEHALAASSSASMSGDMAASRSNVMRICLRWLCGSIAPVKEIAAGEQLLTELERAEHRINQGQVSVPRSGFEDRKQEEIAEITGLQVQYDEWLVFEDIPRGALAGDFDGLLSYHSPELQVRRSAGWIRVTRNLNSEPDPTFRHLQWV
ncbi:MAG TPA: hypothetical protein VFP63_06345, partial [Dehalococcoidia bacterium]|nr:hypothetical protein [Dehalococcoidia bacterium]